MIKLRIVGNSICTTEKDARSKLLDGTAVVPSMAVGWPYEEAEVYLALFAAAPEMLASLSRLEAAAWRYATLSKTAHNAAARKAEFDAASKEAREIIDRVTRTGLPAVTEHPRNVAAAPSKGLREKIAAARKADA